MVSNAVYTMDYSAAEMVPTLQVTDDSILAIGDYNIKAKELRIMLPLMKELLMEKFPEAFI